MIFLSTPQRGSYVAGSWIAHQLARLVRAPLDVTKVMTDFVAGDREALAVSTAKIIPSAVDNMTPGNPFVKVIETATPPKTYVSADARHRRIMPEGGTEPIGRRIIQIPEDPMQVTVRNPHSGFIAYVPPGSIKKGEALAKTGGGGKTIQCAICHGDALTGLGEVPRLAGLQPVYIARQLIQMQNGTSAGTNAALMKKVVAKLSEDDIIAISAYLGSLPPR